MGLIVANQKKKKSGWGYSPPPPPAASSSKSPSKLYVHYRNGKIVYSSSKAGAVMYDGIAITESMLKSQVFDKTGIGGTYYSLTGKSPSPLIVVQLMTGGLTIDGRKLQDNPTPQQLDNFLMSLPSFVSSPTGLKYKYTYQDVWSKIMGNNQIIPANLVEQAAKDNLDATEFAARLRTLPIYLQSNEFQSKVDAYTLSYEKIYGQSLNDAGMQNLAKDAALAGWDPTQWEAYLRSLPEYTSTYEYQGHALDILDRLGMDFGMMFGLGKGGYTPKNTSKELNAPPTDKRVNKGRGSSAGGVSDNLGVDVVNV